MENKERRQEIRVNKHNTFKFKIVYSDPSDSLVMEGLLVDYSIGGIRFMTDVQLEKNISLYIQLDLDGLSSDQINWRDLWESGNDAYLNVVGSVMWCHASANELGKFEVGTRFTQKAFDKLTSGSSDELYSAAINDNS